MSVTDRQIANVMRTYSSVSRDLIKKANQWLQQNPSLKVVNCESVESKGRRKVFKGGPLEMADTESSTFYEKGKDSSWFHRSLR